MTKSILLTRLLRFKFSFVRHGYNDKHFDLHCDAINESNDVVVVVVVNVLFILIKIDNRIIIIDNFLVNAVVLVVINIFIFIIIDYLTNLNFIFLFYLFNFIILNYYIVINTKK